MSARTRFRFKIKASLYQNGKLFAWTEGAAWLDPRSIGSNPSERARPWVSTGIATRIVSSSTGPEGPGRSLDLGLRGPPIAGQTNLSDRHASFFVWWILAVSSPSSPMLSPIAETDIRYLMEWANLSVRQSSSCWYWPFLRRWDEGLERVGVEPLPLSMSGRQSPPPQEGKVRSKGSSVDDEESTEQGMGGFHRWRIE